PGRFSEQARDRRAVEAAAEKGAHRSAFLLGDEAADGAVKAFHHLGGKRSEVLVRPLAIGRLPIEARSHRAALEDEKLRREQLPLFAVDRRRRRTDAEIEII